MRTLVTERLTLEPLEARHAEGMYGGLCDPELHQFLVERPPESVEWLRQRYERLSQRQSDDGRELWWNWVLRLTHNGDFVGTVQAMFLGPSTRARVVYFAMGHTWDTYGQMAVYLRLNGLVPPASQRP